MRFKWTEEKIELLRKYYPNTDWEELFSILGTAKKSSIMTMASIYHISRDIYNNCRAKDFEIEYIRENNGKMMAHEMATNLGKSVTFVCRIISRLGMKPKSRIRVLKGEDVELFKELYPKYTNKYLHEKYFPYLDRGQLHTQARRFGLVKNSDKTIKWYDREQLLEDLENSIKEHGRVPMVTELRTWGLPSEKTFSRYFGNLTVACNLLGIERPDYMKPLTLKDGILRDKNNNPCLSHSELIISNFLIEQGYLFEKEYHYKNTMPFEECGNKRFDWKIGDKYIEFFGLLHYDGYDEKTTRKIELCNKYHIKLLPLYTKDLTNASWKKKILNFLNE